MFLREQQIRAEITPENMNTKIGELLAIDAENRVRLIEIANAGMIVSPYDYYRASLMFLHQTEGDAIENMQIAFEYAMTSMRLGCLDAPYTVARTYDRMLLTMGRGQRYGTQFERRGVPKPMHEGIVPMSAAVREQLDVPAEPTLPSR